MNETIVVDLDIMQVTQTVSRLEVETKVFLILVVMTLDQAWPSYFLSMPCICDKDKLLRDNKCISNRMSSLNVMGRNETISIIILS
jgi:hypothetical protein